MTIAGAVVGGAYGAVLETINWLYNFRLQRRLFFYGNLAIAVAGVFIVGEISDRTQNTIAGPLFWLVYSCCVIAVTFASAQRVYATRPESQRFQFQIRTVLMVTACCAGVLALGSAAVQNHRERKALLEPIESIGGEIGTSSRGEYLTVRRHITDLELETLCEHLRQFPRLYHVYIYGKVSDRGIAHLGQLTQLRELVLSNNSISDAGIEHLVALQALEELHLGQTNVTDEGAAMLAQLLRLRSLYLDGTDISDAGLVHLEGLSKLKMLSLTGTDLSAEAVNRLREKLPETYINF